MGQAIPFLVLLCLQAAFLTVSADKKGPPINIGKQEGGDIRGGRQPGAGSSFFKVQQQQIWNVYKDDDGKFVIPYVFENMSSYNPEELFNFALAMDQIDRNTCIRFRPRRNEHDYIYIKNERNGCYSAGAGRGGGQQILGLQSDRFGRCTDVKTLIHEMIHAIGFVHEHNRYDRDNHVKIHLENVRAKYEPQFHKASFYQSHTYDVPYDYHSIMHYEKDSFAKRKGAITIETLDEKYQRGRQKSLEKHD
ncbi:hypothetical protein Y032_0053g2408 [Ancylostoma ceylanicum]|uniref:Metalloendopeptidase n=1 Tax=Ancylostoma ceylanicum TaxID=53326 RepID=A0A016U6N4_9BILA|nr:hypothetical protein Y032_0053g2408 [Ancylostoma ceylanicum]